MDDDPHVIDKGWDALPEYGNASGDADDAVTVSVSTTPGEWLVNTTDSVVVPMSMADLVDALRARKLTERSLVWRAGMQEWAPVDKVPQLKLAARLQPSAAPTAAPPPSAAALVRPAPPSSPPASIAARRAASTPQVGLSRRSTLPFGLPPAAGSRPPSIRPSRPDAAPLPSSTDEPGVLAVYDRPAATLSFDLFPVEPRPSPPTPPIPPPHTLAPTTSDSPSPRGALSADRHDLSVVAASQFRSVQRSGKRLVLLSSLASAAAASLLTLWLSSGRTPTPSPAARPATPSLALPVTASAAKVSIPAPPASIEQVSPAADGAETSQPPAQTVTVTPKPAKPVIRRAKAARAPRVTAPPRATGDTTEANPYDVTLEDDASAEVPPPSATSPAPVPELQSTDNEAAATSSSPGF